MSIKLSFVEPSITLLTPPEEIQRFPRKIERAGRTCYRSEDREDADTDEKFCRMLIRRGHESVLEHGSVITRIVCDRATSHQLVRHRLCSFSQESQRFVDYQEHLEVIRPSVFFPRSESYDYAAAREWEETVEFIAERYKTLREKGFKPEDVRSLLPNCTSTRIVMSANVRQWRWVLRERACNPRAQQQIRFLMLSLLEKLHTLVPCLFEDLIVLSKERGIENKESFICGYAK